MLLFLALMIVYIIWYQVKGNEIKKLIQNQDSWSGIQIYTTSWDLMPTISSVIDTEDQTTGNQKVITETNIWIITWINTNTTGITVTPKVITGTVTKTTTWTVTKTTTGTMNKNSTIKLLSGTSIYYWPIEIIEKLGIKYQYALADSSGIRYIYLGTPSYDFASIARALKWDIYTIATEQEMIQNKLFGNKVVYINLPEYKDKQVLMLVYMNDGIRLIQIDYALYHKSKIYLKSLFTN